MANQPTKNQGKIPEDNPVQTPDVGNVPSPIREYIDKAYGRDFHVIALSDRYAHIENASRSFKITLPS